MQIKKKEAQTKEVLEGILPKVLSEIVLEYRPHREELTQEHLSKMKRKFERDDGTAREIDFSGYDLSDYEIEFNPGGCAGGSRFEIKEGKSLAITSGDRIVFNFDKCAAQSLRVNSERDCLYASFREADLKDASISCGEEMYCNFSGADLGNASLAIRTEQARSTDGGNIARYCNFIGADTTGATVAYGACAKGIRVGRSGIRRSLDGALADSEKALAKTAEEASWQKHYNYQKKATALLLVLSALSIGLAETDSGKSLSEGVDFLGGIKLGTALGIAVIGLIAVVWAERALCRGPQPSSNQVDEEGDEEGDEMAIQYIDVSAPGP